MFLSTCCACCRSHVIARLGSLLKLNGSPVRDTERRDAEKTYIKQLYLECRTAATAAPVAPAAPVATAAAVARDSEWAAQLAGTDAAGRQKVAEDAASAVQHAGGKAAKAVRDAGGTEEEELAAGAAAAAEASAEWAGRLLAVGAITKDQKEDLSLDKSEDTKQEDTKEGDDSVGVLAAAAAEMTVSAAPAVPAPVAMDAIPEAAVVIERFIAVHPRIAVLLEKHGPPAFKGGKLGADGLGSMASSMLTLSLRSQAAESCMQVRHRRG